MLYIIGLFCDCEQINTIKSFDITVIQIYIVLLALSEYNCQYNLVFFDVVNIYSPDAFMNSISAYLFVCILIRRILFDFIGSKVARE